MQHGKTITKRKMMKKRTTLDLGLSDGKESLNIKTSRIDVCKTCNGYGEIPDETAGECMPGVWWVTLECLDCKDIK